MNYLAWTAAAVPACGVYFLSRRTALREAAKRVGVFVAGFAVAASAFSTLMLGPGGLARILQLHFSVLTHSGLYGQGGDSMVSTSAMQNALHELAKSWPFFAIVSAVCALSFWVILSNARRGRLATTNAAFLTYLVLTFGLFVAATLKHYGPHYLIAGVPAMGLLLFALGGQISPRMRLALSLMVALLLVHSYRRYWATVDSTYRRVTAMKADLQAVDHLAGRPDAPVLWTYRLPDRRFGLELIRYLCGRPEVAEVIDQKFPTPDLVYFLWNPEVRVGARTLPFHEANWRYAVFESGNFHHFLQGAQAGAKEYLEQHCTKVIDGPLVSVFERKK